MSEWEPMERMGNRGVERREELLGELRPIVQRRGRRRRVARAIALPAIAAAVGVAVWAVWPGAVAAPTREVLAGADANAPRPEVPTNTLREPEVTKVEVISTISGIAQRLSRLSEPVQAATDEDLMAALRASGREPGIVRIDGQIVPVGGLGDARR
jgi:hypothetical protein